MTAHGGKAGQLAFSSGASLRPWHGKEHRRTSDGRSCSRRVVHTTKLRVTLGLQAVVDSWPVGAA